eukprot:gene17608-23941_t
MLAELQLRGNLVMDVRWVVSDRDALSSGPGGRGKRRARTLAELELSGEERRLKVTDGSRDLALVGGGEPHSMPKPPYPTNISCRQGAQTQGEERRLKVTDGSRDLALVGGGGPHSMPKTTPPHEYLMQARSADSRRGAQTQGKERRLQVTVDSMPSILCNYTSLMWLFNIRRRAEGAASGGIEMLHVKYVLPALELRVMRQLILFGNTSYNIHPAAKQALLDELRRSSMQETASVDRTLSDNLDWQGNWMVPPGDVFFPTFSWFGIQGMGVTWTANTEGLGQLKDYPFGGVIIPDSAPIHGSSWLLAGPEDVPEGGGGSMPGWQIGVIVASVCVFVALAVSGVLWLLARQRRGFERAYGKQRFPSSTRSVELGAGAMNTLYTPHGDDVGSKITSANLTTSKTSPLYRKGSPSSARCVELGAGAMNTLYAPHDNDVGSKITSATLTTSDISPPHREVRLDTAELIGNIFQSENIRAGSSDSLHEHKDDTSRLQPPTTGYASTAPSSIGASGPSQPRDQPNLPWMQPLSISSATLSPQTLTEQSSLRMAMHYQLDAIVDELGEEEERWELAVALHYQLDEIVDELREEEKRWEGAPGGPVVAVKRIIFQLLRGAEGDAMTTYSYGLKLLNIGGCISLSGSMAPGNGLIDWHTYIIQGGLEKSTADDAEAAIRLKQKATVSFLDTYEEQEAYGASRDVDLGKFGSSDEDEDKDGGPRSTEEVANFWESSEEEGDGEVDSDALADEEEEDGDVDSDALVDDEEGDGDQGPPKSSTLVSSTPKALKPATPRAPLPVVEVASAASLGRQTPARADLTTPKAVKASTPRETLSVVEFASAAMLSRQARALAKADLSKFDSDSDESLHDVDEEDDEAPVAQMKVGEKQDCLKPSKTAPGSKSAKKPKETKVLALTPAKRPLAEAPLVPVAPQDALDQEASDDPASEDPLDEETQAEDAPAPKLSKGAKGPKGKKASLELKAEDPLNEETQAEDPLSPKLSKGRNPKGKKGSLEAKEVEEPKSEQDLMVISLEEQIQAARRGSSGKPKVRTKIKIRQAGLGAEEGAGPLGAGEGSVGGDEVGAGKGGDGVDKTAVREGGTAQGPAETDMGRSPLGGAAQEPAEAGMGKALQAVKGAKSSFSFGFFGGSTGNTQNDGGGSGVSVPAEKVDDSETGRRWAVPKPRTAEPSSTPGGRPTRATPPSSTFPPHRVPTTTPSGTAHSTAAVVHSSTPPPAHPKAPPTSGGLGQGTPATTPPPTASLAQPVIHSAPAASLAVAFKSGFGFMRDKGVEDAQLRASWDAQREVLTADFKRKVRTAKKNDTGKPAKRGKMGPRV